MTRETNGLVIRQASDKTILRLLVFMWIFLTSGFVVTNDVISSLMTMALWAVVVLFLAISCFYIDRKIMIAFTMLIACKFISSLLNNENIRNLFVQSFAFLGALFFACTYKLEDFKHAFIWVMGKIALISLIGFFAYLCVPELENLFRLRNSAGTLCNNWYLFVHIAGLDRNLGLFWEPGAFQTFLCLALMLEVLEKRINVKKIILFLVTIITTFSTTGYIGIAFILLLAISGNKGANNKYKYFFLFIILAISVLAYCYQDKLFGNGNTVFGKVTYYLDSGTINEQVTSASVRVNSIVQPFFVFLSHPLFGVGYEGLNLRLYEYTHNMNTCTFVNFFADYGIGYGLVMLGGFFKLARKLTGNKFQTIVAVLIFAVITISENYVDNSFFALLALYGWGSNNERVMQCV